MDHLSEKWRYRERVVSSISNLRQIFWDSVSRVKGYVTITSEDLENAGVCKGREGADRSKTDLYRN